MTTLRKGDYAAALKLSEQFNIKAGARPNRKVKAVLSQAVDFLEPIAKSVGEKGAVITVGSAWTGPDVFLDADIAKKRAREKERIAYLTGDVELKLAQRDEAKLKTIRKAFGLRSDKQAAALALHTYAGVCDHLWRGNSFTIERKSPQGKTRVKPLNTDKVKPIVGPGAIP